MSRFILSGFADEMYDEIEKQAEGFNEIGFDNLELRFIDGKNVADLNDQEVEKVKSVLESHDIKVSAIGSPLGKINLDDDWAAHLEKAKRVFRTANMLGAKFIRMFSFYPAGYPEKEKFQEGDFDIVVEKLAQLLDLADEYGVVLCHENEYRVWGESPEASLQLLQHFGGRMKCVFDMGNYVLEHFDPVKAYEMTKEYIAYFHIKDGTNSGAIVPPGLGEAKIKEILALHKSEVVVSLEPHLCDFTGLSALTGGNDLDQSASSGYADNASAYRDAARRLRELIAEID